jgi:hypothetical protein
VYLHQVVKQSAAGLCRFDDLPLALADEARSGLVGDERWRVHFHVPLFTDQYGDFSSTRADIVPLLRVLGETAEPPHLEVETYTWNVLPEAFRDRPIADAIAAELDWTRQQLLAARPI